MERDDIEAAIRANGGDITKAARSLGAARRTLQNRMRKYGMARGRSGRKPRKLSFRRKRSGALATGVAVVAAVGLLGWSLKRGGRV